MWFLSKELMGTPGLPTTSRGITCKATNENWLKRKPEGVKGRAFEYHIDSLPIETQRHLRKEQASKALKDIVEKFELEEPIAERQAKEKAKRESLAKELMHISQEHREKALVRAELVSLYHSFINAQSLSRGDRAIDLFLKAVNTLELPFARDNKDVIDMTRIGSQMLYRWVRVFRQDGVIGLALEFNKAKSRKGRSLISEQPDMAEFIIATMIEYPTTNDRKMLTLLEARYGESTFQLPSQSSLRIWMSSWKEKNASSFTYMTNPDKWRNEFMSAFGDASEIAQALNDLWELDATPGDIECVWEGNRKRVHISGVIDVWSRRARFLVTETPRTEANAMLMRGALLEWGKPVTCKTDNGSDYVSNRMKQTFISLSIEQMLCTPFHPQEKPHIERVFRTFSHDWLEMMPGYVGHNVAERKGIEARKSFANRLMNKGDIIEAKLSPQDLQTFCDQWLEIYHHREHGALGCSPFVKATSWNGVIDRVSDERALDMLLASPAGNNGRRKIAKKGIKVDGIWYISPELNVGDWVYVYYDESDIGRLVVYNDDHAFLCIAQAPDFTGVSRKELASAAKRKQTQQMQLAHKAAREARSKYNIRDLAEEVMNHELTQARNVAAFPQREVEFTSSTLEAGREAHDALSSIDSPSQGSSLTEAEVRFLEEDIVRIQKEERAKQCEDETEEGRFIRWIELHEKMEAGEELDELNGQWKARYETSSDFKGRKMMFDDWGKAAFVK